MFYSSSMKHHIMCLKKLLIVNLLASIQLLIFLNSLFKSSEIPLKPVASIKKNVSSANRIEKSSSDDLEKAFM